LDREAIGNLTSLRRLGGGWQKMDTALLTVEEVA
jgi:hypothetical protein